MFAILSQHDLLKALQHVTRAVEASSPLPILAGVLLEAYSDHLSLTASSTRMRIQVDIPLAVNSHQRSQIVAQPGRIVIPARYMLEMLRKFPHGDVVIESDEQLILTIRSDSTIYRLCGMEAEQFPVMPRPDSFDCTIQLPNRLLKSTVRQVAFAVSTSEARPVLTGVLCRVDAGALRFLATDGIRLASHTVELPTEPVTGSPIQVVVPGKTLSELCKMLDNEDEVTELSISRNQIRFSNPSFQLLSVLLDGTFPPTEKLIPQSCSTEITVSSTSMLQALERVSLLAGEDHLVRLSTVSASFLRISTVSSPIGDAVAEVPLLSMNGEPATIYLNSKYMAEIMRVMEGVDVRIRLASSMSPLVIVPVGAQAPLYLLTLIRHRDAQSA